MGEYKKVMKKKLHKLHVQEAPFAILAIVCPESQLKFSWLMNTTLGFELKESDSLVIEENTGETFFFPTHKDNSSIPELQIMLVKNKNEGKILLRSLPNIDFIIKIEGALSPLKQKDFAKRIKTVPGVLGALLLETEKVKDISSLRGL